MQERRVVKCYCEPLQRKGLLSVASFPKSLLRGSRQKCSVRCHRLRAPKFPALFCRTHARWVFICRSSRQLSLLPPVHLGRSGTALEHGPRQGLCLEGHDLADTSSSHLASVQPPVLFKSLLRLPVSASPSSSPGWFYTSVVTREPRRGSFELGS